MEVGQSWFEWSVVTLFRSASIIPPSPPSNFLLSLYPRFARFLLMTNYITSSEHTYLGVGWLYCSEYHIPSMMFIYSWAEWPIVVVVIIIVVVVVVIVVVVIRAFKRRKQKVKRWWQIVSLYWMKFSRKPLQLPSQTLCRPQSLFTHHRETGLETTSVTVLWLLTRSVDIKTLGSFLNYQTF